MAAARWGFARRSVTAGDRLRPLQGRLHTQSVTFFTLLPGSIPRRLLESLLPLDARLDRSPAAPYSTLLTETPRKDPRCLLVNYRRFGDDAFMTRLVVRAPGKPTAVARHNSGHITLRPLIHRRPSSLHVRPVPSGSS